MTGSPREWAKDLAFWLLDQRKTRGYHLMNDLAFWTRGQPVEVIFDIGANAGQTVDRFKGYFPDARIEAFEPVSATFDTLQNRVGNLSEVHCHPFALGETNETKRIRLEPDSCLNSLSNEVATETAGDSVEQISIQTLDAFCEKENIRHIDILKTDTEGYDFEVLEGGKSLLNRQGVDFIITESSFRPSNERQTFFSLLNEYLQDNGYRVAGFYEVEHEAGSRPAINYCNVLYAREGLLE